MEVWEGPGQFLYPVPDGAGGLAGHRSPGLELPLPLGDWGPGQRRRRLGPNIFTSHVVHLGQNRAALLRDTVGDWLTVYDV